MAQFKSKVESENEILGKRDAAVTRFFQESRHVEEIVGITEDTEERDIWRKYGKERMKTMSVALVLCLHIGVDPPDKEARQNPAKLQAWFDPYSCSQPKAMATIANRLQTQYGKMQSRARYKVAPDPTVEEVRKLCVAMRRNSKSERVLFHYNGHGVPRPTNNGEIWVFNKAFTQYIPLSIYDLQSWMESPSIYVWECDSAETIIHAFNRFALDHEKEWTVDLDDFQEKMEALPPISSSMGVDEQAEALRFPKKRPRFKECIQLAACRVDETLPSDPDMPADLFTSCLTTPIQTSVLWYLVRNGRASEFAATSACITGPVNDRRTPMGELHWIFTAITDTLAWNVLPRDVFQQLFRQDLLLASLFRSFLLAERIMVTKGCHVVSCPALPSTSEHPLWDSWDYTLDLYLTHLSNLNLGKYGIVCPLGKDYFCHSRINRLNTLVDQSAFSQEAESGHNWFFIEQLRAFEVWLEYGVDKKVPPQQLPVVLQVLLSQVHRLRALELLARFLDHGQWAVGYALSVGIFPYVLKLLQSSTRELKPWLAFIWAKILAVDPGCQAELFKENGEESRYNDGQRRDRKELRFFYFVKILNDPMTSPRQKVVPAFVLATLFHNNFIPAQQNLTEHGYVNLCTEMMTDGTTKDCRLLKLWILIGLGRLWADYNDARWQAIRLVAYSKVIIELDDPAPEVRAGAVYALGCLIKNRTGQNEHALSIVQDLCDALCSKCARDGAVLVREELLVALQYFVMDSSNTLICLHRSLQERARQMPSREDSRVVEEEDDVDAVQPAIEEAAPDNKGWLNSIRSEKSFMGKRKKQTSESRAILEELVAATGKENVNGCTFPTTFDSVDIIYREEAVKMLSLLESKNFADPHERVWVAVLRLSLDPIEKVARMAQQLVRFIDREADKKEEKMQTHASVTDITRLEFISLRSNSNRNDDQSGEETDRENENGGGVMFTVGSPQMQSCANFPALLSQQRNPMRKSSLPAGSSTPRSRGQPKAEIPPFFSPIPDFQPKRKFNVPEPRKVAREVPISTLAPHEQLLHTQFVPWCSRLFTEPILDLIQCDTSTDADMDRVLTQSNPTDWAIHSEEGMRQTGVSEFKRLPTETAEQLMSVRWGGRRVTCSTFSPLRPIAYFCDGDTVLLVQIDQKPHVIQRFPVHGGNPFVTDVCEWICVLNGMSHEMLLTGSLNGVIRVWDPCFSIHSHKLEGEPSLVTAAYPMSDQPRMASDRGKDTTVFDWNQATGRLTCGGNLKVVRLWDAHTEQAVLDIPTGRRSAVTAISSDLDRSSLVAVAFRDGSIHAYDQRIQAAGSRILALAEHSRPLVGLSLTSTDGKTVLAAASDDGLMCLWEPRMYKEPTVDKNLLENERGAYLDSMVMHDNAEIFACVQSSQFIRVFDISGIPLSCSRQLDGLARPFPRLSGLAFHPYRPVLSCGAGRDRDASLLAYVLAKR